MPGAVGCQETSATAMTVAVRKEMVRAVIIVQNEFRRNKAEADEPAGRPLY